MTVLAHHVQHLVLGCKRLQFGWVLGHGNAQEQAFVEGYEVKEMQQSGAREQASVEVIYRLVELVIIGVEVALALQELHLAGHPLALEHADGLLYRALHAVDGHVGSYDFLHALLDGAHCLRCHRLSRVQFAVVSPAHGVAYDDVPMRVKVLHRLDQHEEERACVGVYTGWRLQGEELYVLVVIEPVVHPLHLVVHRSGYWPVVHVQSCVFIHLVERTPEGYMYLAPVVLASDGQRIGHVCAVLFFRAFVRLCCCLIICLLFCLSVCVCPFVRLCVRWVSIS